MIDVRDLTRTFQVPERDAGLRAAARSLVRRRTTEVRAVDGVSFGIEAGEVVGFLGPNGAGKTTTLKMLSGLLHPTTSSSGTSPPSTPTSSTVDLRVPHRGADRRPPDRVAARRAGHAGAVDRCRRLGCQVLAWVHLRVGVLNELQYRINFFVQLAQSLLALAAGVAVLALVFSRTPALNGWSHPELLAVFGVHLITGGFIGSLIQPNMERLMRDVRVGTLDFALTKPGDAQLLVSVREYRIWQGVDVLIGLVVLGVAAVQLEASIGWGDLAAFVAALALGTFMLYCFWLVPQPLVLAGGPAPLFGRVGLGAAS